MAHRLVLSAILLQSIVSHGLLHTDLTEYLLYGSISPVEAVIVTLVCAFTDTASFQSLVFCESGEHTEDDRNTRVQSDTHQTRAAAL